VFVLQGINPVSSLAQSIGKMKRRADKSFQNKDYYNASKWYAAVLYDSPLVRQEAGAYYPFQFTHQQRHRKIRESKKGYFLYQLAESYRLNYHYKEAAREYEQYISLQDNRFPLARVWYGLCLQATDQPEKARDVLNQYLQKNKKQDAYTALAKQGVANAGFAISNKKAKARYAVEKIKSVGSADGSNFGFIKETATGFLFTSSRHEINRKKEISYPVKIYTGNFQIPGVEKIKNFPDALNMGAPSLSADGLTLFFTGWKDDPKNTDPAYRIYMAKRKSTDSNWQAAVPLAAPVNIPGYHSKQPYLSKDNQYLLFASDQPGSLGKYDIWMVKMEGEQPVGEAMNLGTAVNSTAEEASPFYDAVAGDLYFSSDGRTGMGGMDVYRVKGLLAANSWTGVTENLGYPVNSVKDDLYYQKETTSDTAYLSSDRASACCMEIFKVYGIPYADSAAIAQVKKDTVYVEKPAMINFNPAEKDKEKAWKDSVDAITSERMHINYQFASARIRKADYGQLNNVVRMLKENPQLNILVASFTDCIGSKKSNELLSKKRSESVKAYLLKKGIDASRINLDFFGKQHMIMACKEDSSYNRAEQIANRRSDLIITNQPNPKWIPSGKELDIDVKGSDLLPEKTTQVVTASSSNLSAKGKMPGKTNQADQAKQGQGYRRQMSNQPITGATAQKQSGKTTKPVAEVPLVTVKKTKPATGKIAKVDSLTGVMKINELLDFKPRLKNGDVINEMTSRTPKKFFEVYSRSDSVKVELYDNGVFDNDSVSVIYNKELVIYKRMLQTTKPISFYVKLNSDQLKNEMIFFAENLGLTPPNSALMIITDGDNKRTEINVSSDLQHNAVIYFIKVKK
jgi:outer membrane protein OmpA-like peptidoglycan-associated protein